MLHATYCYMLHATDICLASASTARVNSFHPRLTKGMLLPSYATLLLVSSVLLDKCYILLEDALTNLALNDIDNMVTLTEINLNNKLDFTT